MKVSEGGLGAPLFNVLGVVLQDLAVDSTIAHVTASELARRVRDTDSFTSDATNTTYRSRVPGEPSRSSIGHALRRARSEGLISTSREHWGLRIVILKPWPKYTEWGDEHDPSQCHCGSALVCLVDRRLTLQPTESRQAVVLEHWRSSHASCGKGFPCRDV
jgi:hypothetical protein